jgi:hypothetical protein
MKGILPKNTLKTGKRGGKTSTSWKPGQSGNVYGRPVRGESWAEIIKRIGDMTPIEAADHANEIAKQLRKIGGALTLKEAVVVRVYAALLFEPQASLLNTFMERAEGKITQPLDMNIIKVIFEDAEPDSS